MAQVQLTLTNDERNFLVSLLEERGKEKQIEEHRTRSPNYRELVLQEEALINALLEKLKQA